MADMDSKRGSFKTVCHKYLLTINNESVFFFQSKMDQTKHKPLRKRDFLRLFVQKLRPIFGTYFENKYKE